MKKMLKDINESIKIRKKNTPKIKIIKLFKKDEQIELEKCLKTLRHIVKEKQG